jgi:hypothetical protein
MPSFHNDCNHGDYRAATGGRPTIVRPAAANVEAVRLLKLGYVTDGLCRTGRGVAVQISAQSLRVAAVSLDRPP